MKKFLCILFALFLIGSFYGEEVKIPKEEPVPCKELAKLLKSEKIPLWQARELVYGLSEADQQKLKTVWKTDPASARKMIMEKYAQKLQYKSELAERIRKTAEEYKTCHDKKVRKEIHIQLKKLMTEQFNYTSEEIRNQLNLQEKRLYDIRKAYEKRMSNAPQQIDLQVKRMLKGSSRKSNKKLKDGKKNVPAGEKGGPQK